MIAVFALHLFRTNQVYEDLLVARYTLVSRLSTGSSLTPLATASDLRNSLDQLEEHLMNSLKPPLGCK